MSALLICLLALVAVFLLFLMHRDNALQDDRMASDRSVFADDVASEFDFCDWIDSNDPEPEHIPLRRRFQTPFPDAAPRSEFPGVF
jgi:hypothetical protein